MRECPASKEAGEYLAEPKQARGVAAQNFFLIRTTQLESSDDFNRALVAHVKAVVATHHHVISSNEFDQVIERLRSVADRVEGEASEIIRRWLLQGLALLPHFPSMIETADEIGKSAAGMREANLKLRETIKQSGKDYIGGSQGS